MKDHGLINGTFTIPPIKTLLRQEMEINQIWIDPLAGLHSPAAVTNDINKKMPTQYHEDALEFLKRQPTEYYDGALYDLPYSAYEAKRHLAIKKEP